MTMTSGAMNSGVDEAGASLEPAADAPPALVLAPRSGTTGSPLVLKRGRLVAGSSPAADIVFPAEGVREHHCLILVGANSVIVKAWDPRTWVNEAPVRETVLRLGDQLTIGPHTFQLRPASTEELLDALSGGQHAEADFPQLSGAEAKPAGESPAGAERRSALLNEQTARLARLRDDFTNEQARWQRESEAQQRRLEAWEQELAEQRAAWETRSQSLLAQEALNRTLKSDLEQRQRDLSRQLETLEAERSDLIEQGAALQQACETRQSMLGRLEQDFIVREATLTQREQILEQKSNELYEQFMKFDHQRDELESRERMLSRREADLNRRGEEVALREQQIASREAFVTSAEARHAELEAARVQQMAHLDSRESAAHALEMSLAERESALEILSAELEQQLLETRLQEETLARREKRLEGQGAWISAEQARLNELAQRTQTELQEEQIQQQTNWAEWDASCRRAASDLDRQLSNLADERAALASLREAIAHARPSDESQPATPGESAHLSEEPTSPVADIEAPPTEMRPSDVMATPRDPASSEPATDVAGDLTEARERAEEQPRIFEPAPAMADEPSRETSLFDLALRSSGGHREDELEESFFPGEPFRHSTSDEAAFRETGSGGFAGDSPETWEPVERLDAEPSADEMTTAFFDHGPLEKLERAESLIRRAYDDRVKDLGTAEFGASDVLTDDDASASAGEVASESRGFETVDADAGVTAALPGDEIDPWLIAEASPVAEHAAAPSSVDSPADDADEQAKVRALRSQLADLFGISADTTISNAEGAGTRLMDAEDGAFSSSGESFFEGVSAPPRSDDETESIGVEVSPSPAAAAPVTPDEATGLVSARFLSGNWSSPAPAPTAASAAPSAEESHEESVAAYMERLLARQRRPDQEGCPAVTPEPVAMMTVSPAAEVFPETAPEAIEPRQRPVLDVPAVRANMQSLREIANSATRSAIQTSLWKQSRMKFSSRLLLTGATAGIGGILVFFPGARFAWLGIVVEGLAIYLAYDTYRTWQSLQQNLGPLPTLGATSTAPAADEGNVSAGETAE